MRKIVNETIHPITAVTIKQSIINIPDPSVYTHLSFRRFAGCPVCNLHMAKLKQSADLLENENIKEVIVFYSKEKSAKNILNDLPFEIIADPKRRLFNLFGVEKSISSVLNKKIFTILPSAVGFAIKSKKIICSIPDFEESPFGLPAEFLIAPSGKIIALKYGLHAYDQWNVDEIIMNKNSYEKHPKLAHTGGVEQAVQE